MQQRSKKPIFPRLLAVCKDLNISKKELLNFLISQGHDKYLLRGNFILSNKMHKQVLSHYQKKEAKKPKAIKIEDVQKFLPQLRPSTSSPANNSKVPAIKTRLTSNQLQNTPRLMAAAKEFNIGKATLVEFLVSKGFNADDLKPTAKLTSQMYSALSREFGGGISEDDEPSVTDKRKLTIGIGPEGQFVVRYYDVAGVIYEKDAQKNLAGIYVSSFNQYAEIIKIFEELINDPLTKESDLQRFLEEHPEFLKNLDYQEVIPQALITTDDSIEWRADFMLVPFHQLQFCKILELKLPSTKINQKKKSGHTSFSSKLYKAIQQLKEYAKAFQSRRTKELFKKKYNVDVFSPDLQLVIGRAGDIAFKEEYLNLQKETGVKISDWDTYLSEVKRKFT